MMTLILTSILLLGPSPDTDVLHFKTGKILEGTILEETETHYKFELLSQGGKGQTSGAAVLWYAKSEIIKVERMSDEARKKARERAADFRGRRRRLEDAKAAIRARPAKIDDWPALRTEGPNFEILSTCEDEFIREVTVYLEEMFEGYQHYFEAKHNLDRKITVYLLADEEQYVDFQTRRFGAAVLNPAFFVSKANVIVAYNMIDKEKAHKYNADMRGYTREIMDLKKKLRKRQREIDRDYKAALANIADQVSKALGEIKRSNATNKSELRKDIRRQKRELEKELKKEKRQIDEEFDEYREICNTEIEQYEKAARHNRNVLREQNKQMLETLFHEGFHAFATNYLFDASGPVEIPRWLNEGMAMYFEMSVVEAGELIHGGMHEDLLKMLKAQIGAGQTLPLRKILRGGPEMFMVTHQEEQDRSTLYYSESWALVHYLTQQMTRDQLAAYVDAVLGGAPKDEALEELLGRSVERVHQEWEEYVMGLE